MTTTLTSIFTFEIGFLAFLITNAIFATVIAFVLNHKVKTDEHYEKFDRTDRLYYMPIAIIAHKIYVAGYKRRQKKRLSEN